MPDDNLSAQPAALPARAESVTWIPMAAAARRAQVHPRTIRRQIDRGAILGRMEGRAWQVRAQDVDRLYGGENTEQATVGMVSFDEWKRATDRLIDFAERAGRAQLLEEQLAEMRGERDRLQLELATLRAEMHTAPAAPPVVAPAATAPATLGRASVASVTSAVRRWWRPR